MELARGRLLLLLVLSLVGGLRPQLPRLLWLVVLRLIWSASSVAKMFKARPSPLLALRWRGLARCSFVAAVVAQALGP